MQLEYDLNVGALYIRLSDQPVASTREVDGNTNVDLDAAGSLVGIEVISISHPWPVNAILRDYRLPGSEMRQVCAYFGPQELTAEPAEVPFDAPQLTAPAAPELPAERLPVLAVA